MKKLTFIGFIFIISLALLLLAAKPISIQILQPETKIVASIIPDQLSLSLNEETTIKVQLDTKNYKATAADLIITFPSDKISVQSISPDEFMPEVLSQGTIKSDQAAITVGAGDRPKQGVGTIAVLKVKAANQPAMTIVEIGKNSAVAGLDQQNRPLSVNLLATRNSSTIFISSSPHPSPLSSPSPPVKPLSFIQRLSKTIQQIIQRFLKIF